MALDKDDSVEWDKQTMKMQIGDVRGDLVDKMQEHVGKETSPVCSPPLGAARRPQELDADGAALRVQTWYRDALQRRETRISSQIERWIVYEEGTRRKIDEKIQQAQRTGLKEVIERLQQKRKKTFVDAVTMRHGVAAVYEQKVAELRAAFDVWMAENRDAARACEREYRELKEIVSCTWAGCEEDDQAVAKEESELMASLWRLRTLRKSRPRLRFIKGVVEIADFRSAAKAIRRGNRRVQLGLDPDYAGPVDDSTDSETMEDAGTPRRTNTKGTPPTAATAAKIGVTAGRPISKPYGGSTAKRKAPQKTKSMNSTSRANGVRSPNGDTGKRQPARAQTQKIGGRHNEAIRVAIKLDGLAQVFGQQTLDALRRSVEEADADRDGTLSRDQVCRLMELLYQLTGVEAPCDLTLREEVISCFRKFDKDRNGKLSGREVENFLRDSKFRRELEGRPASRAPSRAGARSPSPAPR